MMTELCNNCGLGLPCDCGYVPGAPRNPPLPADAGWMPVRAKTVASIPDATRERPILFSAPMVRKILAGEKTQTRRIIKPQPEYIKGTVAPQETRGEPKRHPSPYFDSYCSGKKSESNPRAMSEHWCWWDEYDRQGNDWIKCPYGVPGYQLWVRETWMEVYDANTVQPTGKCIYRASYEGPEPDLIDGDGFKIWRKDGVEASPWKPSIHMPRWASRIQLEITEVRVERLNKISEADALAEGCDEYWDSSNCHIRPRAAFRQLWSGINGEDSWDANPWVWVISFKRLQPSVVAPGIQPTDDATQTGTKPEGAL